MLFDHDPRKAATNLRKHGVSFEEAVTVFYDRNRYTDYDEAHSEWDQRFFTIGLSSVGRLLFIVHNDEENVIRLISARRATARERRLYEDEIG